MTDDYCVIWKPDGGESVKIQSPIRESVIAHYNLLIRPFSNPRVDITFSIRGQNVAEDEFCGDANENMIWNFTRILRASMHKEDVNHEN